MEPAEKESEIESEGLQKKAFFSKNAFLQLQRWQKMRVSRVLRVLRVLRASRALGGIFFCCPKSAENRRLLLIFT